MLESRYHITWSPLDTMKDLLFERFIDEHPSLRNLAEELDLTKQDCEYLEEVTGVDESFWKALDERFQKERELIYKEQQLSDFEQYLRHNRQKLKTIKYKLFKLFKKNK